jgi:hypothetical protein
MKSLTLSSCHLVRQLAARDGLKHVKSVAWLERDIEPFQPGDAFGIVEDQHVWPKLLGFVEQVNAQQWVGLAHAPQRLIKLTPVIANVVRPPTQSRSSAGAVTVISIRLCLQRPGLDARNSRQLSWYLLPALAAIA